MSTSTITSDRSLSERRFYTGIAIAILATVLVGFSRSFFLAPMFPEIPAPTETIFYVHGVFFTLWILMFVAQVSLIGRGKAGLHRKLGPVGAVLAIVMVVLGVLGALTAANRSTGFIGIPLPPLQFLAIPLFDMFLLPAFIAMAFIQRHKAQSHKRWMLLATLNLVPAAIARWPIVGSLGPVGSFGITDLFIVALVIWDFKSRGKLHPVTLWGGLILIISQPLRLVISGTPVWLGFAEWATALAR
jgi:uncharacterized membrane protein YozB (DUF420 family)